MNIQIINPKKSLTTTVLVALIGEIYWLFLMGIMTKD